jgi:urea carboxylase
VSAAELLEIRDAFPHGGYSLRMEPGSFRLKDHIYDATEFKARQHAAFLEERKRWEAAGVDQFVANDDAPPAIDTNVPEGCRAVISPVTASVWSIAVEPGQRVEAGQRLIVLEAMKMEIAVTAPAPGIVATLSCAPGMLVSAGQVLAAIRMEGA